MYQYIATSILFLIFALGRLISAQDIIPAQPPAWSVGDYWMVETQVYDTGEIRGEPAKAGWQPRQAWRFHVENVEDLAGEPHFVVSVKPVKNNTCPYSFRYWFRASDRRVSRREVHHPQPVAGERQIGPPVVIQDYNEDHPYLADDFPNLPLIMPLFSGRAGSSSGRADSSAFGERKEVESSQSEETADRAAVISKVDAGFLPQAEKSLGDNSKLITLGISANIWEKQLWNSAFPWCLYGERSDQTRMAKRYWLIETGKD